MTGVEGTSVISQILKRQMVADFLSVYILRLILSLTNPAEGALEPKL